MGYKLYHWLLVALADALIFGLVGYYYYFKQPFRRGFFCDDESIRYPFKDSTVPSTVLFAAAVGMTSLVIVTVESFRLKFAGKFTLKKLAAICLPLLIIALFGAGFNIFITDVSKYTIGRLRPHFLNVCNVSLAELCPSEKMHERIYVQNYTCQGEEQLDKSAKETRLSFPSGHSSFSAYTAMFLVLYLQQRMTFRASMLWRPLLQLILILMALFTGLSRISDYKHHWSDVLVGFIYGIVIAIFTIITLFGTWQEDHYRKEQSSAAPVKTPVTENPNDAVLTFQESEAEESPDA